MKKLFCIILSMIMLVFAVSTDVYASGKPAATSITSLSATTMTVTVKWKKKKVKGYQIKYATSKSFKNAKKIIVKSKSQTSKKIKNLKSKKTYYFRVRTYKTKNGKKKFGSWSKTKYIKTKAKARSSRKSKKRGTTVYITPTGTRYHYSRDCAGRNAMKSTLKEARSYGLTPCKKCAGG